MTEPDKKQTDSLDMIFEALADQRRRYALNSLQNYNTSLALANLAEEVTARENESPITATSPEEVKQTYLELYHTHIPKLEAANIVHYDQDTDQVALSEENRRFEPFLEPLAPNMVYDSLSNPTRRQLLFHLLEETHHIESPICIDEICANKMNKIEYNHIHLPKLDDYGIIEWNRSQGFAEQGPQFEEVKPFLKLLIAQHERAKTN